ncbi:MAG: divalent-cation tolerance protein CutA [Verrucomicrobia bacterium]|nr:divalent-cation tolerance protein CutA [Verrucomicrobiota bacterium]
MYLAWTTVATRAEAQAIARDVIDLGLAVCVQIEGPITSVYRWQGKVETAEEYRLCLKCLRKNLPALETRVLSRHPYDTPEWIALPAASVGEKYLSWATSNSTTSPL